MHVRYGFDQPTSGPDTGTMATKKPREIIEWLCEGHSEFWKMAPQGPVVNIYALAIALKRWADGKKDRKAPSQSTLARLYAGESESFQESTLDTLSEYFQVPKAIIRGDVEWNSVEAWGMDINIAELRLISLMRKLNPEQRALIYEQIRVMLPSETPLAAPLVHPSGVLPFRKPHNKG